MNLSLFPRNEDWGTGDEALDLKLTNCLKKSVEHLSLESVFEFYSFGLSLKTRAYNPAFHLSIEQVSKALLFHLHPDEFNDDLFKKMRGCYFTKEKIQFEWNHAVQIIEELKTKKNYRYKSLIDFSLKSQTPEERNPFVKEILRRRSFTLGAKIIFKEYRQFLEGEKGFAYDDEFSNALKSGKILVIEGVGEIWFSEVEIFCLSVIDSDS